MFYQGRLSRIAHDLGWTQEQLLLAHIIGAAIEDLVDEREDSAIVDNDTQDITLGTWRRSAYRYFTGPVFNDHCEWLDTTSEAAIAIFRLQPTLDKLGERMNIEQRIANAVASKDNAALQALADEGWLMNEAPKGAATIKIPNSELVITEHGANDVTYSATVPFSAVETDNGVVHIAIAGRDVYIWSE